MPKVERNRHNIFEGIDRALISGGGNLLKHQPHLILEPQTVWQKIFRAKRNLRIVPYDQIQNCTSEMCRHPKGIS